MCKLLPYLKVAEEANPAAAAADDRITYDGFSTAADVKQLQQQKALEETRRRQEEMRVRLEQQQELRRQQQL